jgi:hypothetical protein
VVSVKTSEMRRALYRNSKAAAALQGSHPPCKALLTFYALESGLKFLIMTDRGDKDSDYVATEIAHNLRRMIKDAAISAAEVPSAFLPNGHIELPSIARQRKQDGTSAIPSFFPVIFQ